MPAGRKITIAEPKIWFSPNPGTQVLPDPDLPYGADWPTGFLQIPYTVNGMQWTMVNPQQDIPADEVGILDTVPSGADTINVTLQARTPTMELIEKIAGFAKQVATGRSQVETFTASAGVTGAGNVVVTLPGLAPVPVALAAGDTTPAAVAAKIAAATYTGYTALQGTGADTHKVVFTRTATGPVSGTASYSAGSTGATGSFASPATQKGRSAFERYTLDPGVNNRFLLGMDGKVQQDSLRQLSGRMRFIAYSVQQTDNPQLHGRTRGNDALMQPVLTARCLNSVIDLAQLVGTSLSLATDVDKNGRFDMYVV